MSRSLKKGPYVDEKLLKKIMAHKATNDYKPIKTWARRSVISPEMVGFTLAIHNGKIHIPVVVSESMVGHKLGEFALTRSFKGHSKKGKIAQATGSTGRAEAPTAS